MGGEGRGCNIVTTGGRARPSRASVISLPSHSCPSERAPAVSVTDFRGPPQGGPPRRRAADNLRVDDCQVGCKRFVSEVSRPRPVCDARGGAAAAAALLVLLGPMPIPLSLSLSGLGGCCHPASEETEGTHVQIVCATRLRWVGPHDWGVCRITAASSPLTAAT